MYLECDLTCANKKCKMFDACEQILYNLLQKILYAYFMFA